jgi:hypothetical protein
MEDRVHWRIDRIVYYDSSELGMCRSYFQREIGAQAFSNKDERAGGNVARLPQIRDSGFRIRAPPPLAGMSELAFAVAAIIKIENVESSPVQRGKRIDRVTDVPVRVMKVNCSKAASGAGRNPPSMKLGLSRVARRKIDGVKCEANVGWGARQLCGWMIEQLPASLPEGEAKRSPDTKRSG